MSHMTIENRFVFVSPAFNAQDTIEQMMASVHYQNYKNWLILFKDDLSTDNTVQKVIEFCHKNHIPYCIDDIVVGENPKVVLWRNQEKKWETRNVLEMIRSEYVRDDDIICRLDPDGDFICDLCAITDINFIYEQTKCDALWTSHRWENQFWKNISGVMPGCYVVDFRMDNSCYIQLVKDNRIKDVYGWGKENWNMSHLKTFRKVLFNNIAEENFKGKDGEYIIRTGDRALFYPILHKSKMPVFFPKQTYFYHIDDKPETYQTNDAKFQRAESDFLSNRGFIDT